MFDSGGSEVIKVDGLGGSGSSERLYKFQMGEWCWDGVGGGA